MGEKSLRDIIEIGTNKIKEEEPDDRIKEVLYSIILVVVLVFRTINKSDLEEEKKLKIFLAFIEKMDEFLNED